MPHALSAGFLVAAVATSASVFGASQRTFVASFGADTNPCSVAQPCRSFGAALVQTLAGGEIIVLDSAGYGSVTINRDVSIIAPPGVYAGITVINPNDFGVKTQGAVFNVKLKGLTFNALTPSGTIGIDWNSFTSQPTSIELERCAFTGFATAIRLDVRIVKVAITDSTFERNAFRALDVIVGGFAVADIGIARSRFTNNGDGSTGAGALGATASGGATFDIVESSFLGSNPRTLLMATDAGFSVMATIRRSNIDFAQIEFAQLPGSTAGQRLEVLDSAVGPVSMNATAGELNVVVQNAVLRANLTVNAGGTSRVDASIADSTFAGSRLVAHLAGTAIGRVDVRNVTFSGSSIATPAIDLDHTGTSNTLRATVVDTIVRGYTNGLTVGDRSFAFLARNTFTSNNGAGVLATGSGQIRSLGDNLSTANSVADTAPTPVSGY